MRKQTHFKKVVSLAVAAAMAVSVCTAALADNAPNEANGQPPVSEQQVEEEPSENDVAALSEEEGKDNEVAAQNEVYIAAVGDQKFATMQEAIDAADGKTVKLLSHPTFNFVVEEGKNVTLDLNGCNLTIPTNENLVIHGTLTVTDTNNGNGTITLATDKTYADASCIVVDGTSAKFVLDNGNINAVGYGIYCKNDGKAVINGGKVTAGQAVLTGNNLTGNMSFEVNGGELTTTEGPSIYMPGPINLTITGGTLNGGIGLRMGQVNISGGTINAITSGIDSPAEYYGYSGNAWLPDALYVFGGTYTSKDASCDNALNLNITGGTFNCANDQGSAVAIYDLGKEAQTMNVSISGNAKLTSQASGRKSYQVLSLSDIGVDNPKTGFGNPDYTGKVSTTVSGGTFSTEIEKSYLAEGYTVEEKDGKFNVVKKVVATPTPAPTATPEPTATPAPTAAPTATPAPTAAPVEVKPAAPVVNDTALKDVTTEEKDKLVKAAESATIPESKELANNETVQNVAKSADDYIAADGTVKDTLKEDILKAADASKELKKAAEANVSNITLVSAPYLAVTPQKSEDGTLVFDIKLYCALKATTDPDNMTAANTCTLKTEKVKDAPVMNITLDVSKAYSGNELNTLYVRHVTESGAVYYYKAYSKGNGIIEFTNPHGFSTFTVLSDTRVAKVKLAGKEYGYDIAGIGVEFPHPDMPGYTYKGYQFDGISGSYTTLTEELFNKLAAAGKTVSATATFSAIATPAPAAAPEATAAPTATPAPTPDDSQYYTCKDCGHHNWTATADGYKCDTCGRIETKQLSGYKNVKGTYTPTASAAAAKTTSAIPQTSDTMPIVPIAIVMIAALLGLGVTLYMKKKKN